MLEELEKVKKLACEQYLIRSTSPDKICAGRAWRWKLSYDIADLLWVYKQVCSIIALTQGSDIARIGDNSFNPRSVHFKEQRYITLPK